MTMRCSRCDVAHDESSRCPTDLEYERGYRSGVNYANKKVADLEAKLSQSACGNVSLRQKLSKVTDERDAARRLLEERDFEIKQLTLVAKSLQDYIDGRYTVIEQCGVSLDEFFAGLNSRKEAGEV